MAEDPFSALRVEYLDRARSRMDRIAALAELSTPDTESLRELRTLVHNLRGSGGFYGFADISSLAGTIEEIVLALQTGKSLSSGVLAEAAQALARAVQTASLP